MQKTILLMRHGEAGVAARDFDRPLTEAGIAQCKAQGAALQQQGLICNVIISSTALRTYSSAVAVAEVIDYPVEKITVSDTLYNAAEEVILPIIKDFDDIWHTVLLIGHNPGLSFLATTLCPEVKDNLDVGQLYAISFPLLHWSDVMHGKGKLNA